MKSRRNKVPVSRRASAVSLLPVLGLLAFLVSACKHGVTGPTFFCDTASFTTFGTDDQEDLVRCVEQGVPIP